MEIPFIRKFTVRGKRFRNRSFDVVTDNCRAKDGDEMIAY